MSLLLEALNTAPLNASEAAECQAYLEELLVNDDLLSTENYTTTSGSTRTIVGEIAELDQQQRIINDQLGELTSHNRDTIIALQHDVSTVTKNLTTRYPDIVALVARPQIGATNIDKLMASVHSTTTVFRHVDAILDLLELPSLARLCVSEGNYHEALEISVLVKSYAIRYPHLEVFAQIQHQVDAELRQMVKGLVRLLSTNVKQHSLAKMLQILTKLDIGPPRVLEALYLQGRFKFIAGELQLLAPLLRLPNKMTYLKRLVEVYREHGFSTLYTHQSLFPGADSFVVSQFAHKLALALAAPLKQYIPVVREDPENDSIDGLLLQLVYLCKSLAKFGANFEVVLRAELAEVVSADDWLRNVERTEKS